MQISFPIPGFIIPWHSKKLEGTNFHPEEKQDSANSTAWSQSSPGHFGRESLCLRQRVVWSHRRGLAEWKSPCWGPKDRAVSALWALPRTRLQSMALHYHWGAWGVLDCIFPLSILWKESNLCAPRPPHDRAKAQLNSMLGWDTSNTHSWSKR